MKHRVAGGDLRSELLDLVRLLVERPEAVRVSESRDGSFTMFRVRLPDQDLGKVIGRQGRTARALRSLLATRGEHDGRRYGLEIRQG